MISNRRWVRAGALPALLLALASCADLSPVAPATEPAALRPFLGGTVTLLECPAGLPRSTTFTAGLFGTSVSLGGNGLVIPLSALLAPTTFTLSIPDSDRVGVRVTAGASEHYDFLLPVALTLSYAHCPAEQVNGLPLRVYHVDRDTGEILEDMGGLNNPLGRSITILTDHFSDYVVGIN